MLTNARGASSGATSAVRNSGASATAVTTGAGKSPAVRVSTAVRAWSRPSAASVTPELDTIIGRHHRQATISLVERKSKNTLLAKIKRNTAEAVARAIIGSLGPYTEKVHTLTADNGREFTRHQAIGERLDARFYFAPPYHYWESGLKENTNGLVRQYFPKKSDFSKVGAADLRRVMQWLNHRPRKTLNFRTPHQVFFKTEEIVFTT